MKTLIKEVLDHVGLLDAVRRTKWNIKREFGRTDRALIERHLASALSENFNWVAGPTNSPAG